jgi:TolB-like protein
MLPSQEVLAMRTNLALAAAAVLGMALAVAGVHADPPRIAVGDFTVLSDNPRLRYVGKGFAELVAAQLSASKSVQLIDREKREALLSEMDFSLSEAADADSQARIGRLLTADYLVFGEIIDMDTAILLSCSMIRVETGEVVWAEKNLGTLTDYDALSRKIAASALKELGAEGAAEEAAAPTKAGPEASAEEKVEAVLAFSKAVDALDRKDQAEAEKQIRVAKAIDPSNRAVAIYAAKLQPGSPRFQVELESFAPGYNPALLGSIQKMTFYYWGSLSRLIGGDVDPDTGIITVDTESGGTLVYKDQGTVNVSGVMLPLGLRLGVMAEISWTGVNGYAGQNPPGAVVTGAGGDVNIDQGYLGGCVGVGSQVAPGLSIGLAFRAAYLGRNAESGVDTWTSFCPEEVGLSYSLAGGVAYRSPGGSLSTDLEVVWSTQPDFYVLSPDGGINSTSLGMFVRGDKPLLISLGATGAFLEDTLFANLKLIGSVGLDSRDLLGARVIPGLEWWPFQWIGLRAAYEYSVITAGEGSVNGGGDSASGSGFMAGVTLAQWGFDLNANYIYRYRPFGLLPGAGHQDGTLLLGLTWGGLVERR